MQFAGNRLRVADEVLAVRPALASFRGRPVILGIRPENMDDASLVTSPHPDSRFPFIVNLREGMGSDVYLHFSVGRSARLYRGHERARLRRRRGGGPRVAGTGERAPVHVLARAGPETTARIGERREIWVDTRKLYFFDPSTGNSIYGDGQVSSIDAVTLTA